MDFQNQKILVAGMARSGIATAKMLYQLGAEVIITDSKKLEEFHGALDDLLPLGFTWQLAEDPMKLIDGVDMVVFSSGIPFWSEWILEAKRRGIPCINELELGFMVTDADFVAITGTNGKTTTTTLTCEIFRNAGIKSYALGNIGVPVCAHALDMKKGDIVVAETTPFQLVSSITYHPKVSAILNITEDHLNWFQTMENYTEKKALIYKNQTKNDFCVLNDDNEITRGLAEKCPARVLLFSRMHEVEEGAFLRDDKILFRLDGVEEEICKAIEVLIPGPHNTENALAAVCMAKVMGISKDVIVHTLQTFRGVEHRIETAGVIQGVTYINDSKGTNTDATIKAIEAMDRDTVLILGGYDKKTDFHPMFEAFTHHIVHIVVLGQTADQLLQTAKDCHYQNITRADSMEDAVFKAKALCHPGMNVLLSPPCASFDMFCDYEERGRVFKKIVWGLMDAADKDKTTEYANS